MKLSIGIGLLLVLWVIISLSYHNWNASAGWTIALINWLGLRMLSEGKENEQE